MMLGGFAGHFSVCQQRASNAAQVFLSTLHPDAAQVMRELESLYPLRLSPMESPKLKMGCEMLL
jgi:hypothetical protein